MKHILAKPLAIKKQLKALTLPDYVGWFASFMASAMYISYIDQIMLNLSGQTGSIILPLVTTINCIAWMAYGFLKPITDWPILCCNFPGVMLGIITVVTAIIY